MGIFCMTQESQTGLCDNIKGGVGRKWEGVSGRRGHGCTYGWFLLMCDRKPQNYVKKLSFNLKKKSGKKKELKKSRYIWCPKVVTIKSSWKPQEGLPMGCLDWWVGILQMSFRRVSHFQQRQKIAQRSVTTQQHGALGKLTGFLRQDHRV